MTVAVRNDILFMDGGKVLIYRAPSGSFFNFGFPFGKVKASIAEAKTSTLKGRSEDYNLGKSISRQRMEMTNAISTKDSFHLSGFRSFDHKVTERQIRTVRRRVNQTHRSC